jgi:prevent-host-death family protein
MSAHSVAEAKNRLSRLIDRAFEGEEIVITRRGHPVVVLRPVAKPARAVTAADLDWLAEHRIGEAVPVEDAGELLTNLRDEDEQ